METRIAAPRGTKDILPGESWKWQYVEAKARELCRRYNFRELRTPVFEHTELFSRLGEETEVVQKEMYTFLDRGGRSITLRPEGTASAVRAYIEHGMDSLPQPVKLFYIGPMFRYERPQGGRLRQHHQFGAEVIGSGEPAADLEVISLALDFYRAVGLKGLVLYVNSIGCRGCRERYRKALSDYFSSRLGELCPDCERRYGRNILRILDCKSEDCGKAIRDAPQMLEFLCGECRSHFESVKSLLDSFGIGYRVNPLLVRGLDYYTRTVFEVSIEALGSLLALGGGGRYDQLAEELGGKRTPAVGFGLGLERVLLALEEERAEIPDPRTLEVFVASTGGPAVEAARRLVFELRRGGFSADMDYAGRSLKAQMRHASREGVRWTVILGEEETSRGVAAIRDMATGYQMDVPIDEVIGTLRRSYVTK